MVIWSGWGALTVLLAILAIAVGVVLDPVLANANIGLPAQSGLVLGWVLAAILNWIIGTRLNSRPGRELVDPQTGQRVILRSRHTLFWIPMQYYSVLMLLLAVLAVIGALNPGPPRGSSKPV